MDDVDDAKRRAAQGAKDSHGSNGPEDELEVKVIADVGAVEGLGDGHGEDGVGDHPGDDHVGADGAVVVLLLLGVGDGVAGGLEAVAEVAEGLVVAGVDVELLRRHLELDGGAALGGDAGGAEVGVDDVVAFGAPGDVVRVAEGVHLQRADVRRQQGEVLCRRGEHVPWVQVQEGHEEVQPERRAGRDDQVREDVVAQREARAGVFELRDDDVERCEGRVSHDD